MKTPARTVECAHCRLPVTAAEQASSEPVYCCLGCWVAAQIARDKSDGGGSHATLVRIGLAIFLSMNVMMFTMALWTQELSDPQDTVNHLASALGDLLRYLCLVLTLPVLWLLGKPLWDHSWHAWRNQRATADLLILVGVSAACVYSAYSVIQGSGHIYFEVACVVLVMVTLGRWLEATGRLQTTAALDALEKMMPEKVRVIEAGEVANAKSDQSTREFCWRAWQDINAGDVVLVYAGERIPVDGELIAGQALVDQQALTGESEPVLREVGQSVLEGSLSTDGELVVRARCAAREGTWSRLIALIREGRARQGHYERLTQRTARLLLPIVMLVAGLTFVVQFSFNGLEAGMLDSLAVLLIACPCALGLATPMAICTAFGTALEHQVLFRGGEDLERLANVSVLRFDKTGTLTTGSASVTRFIAADRAKSAQVLRSAADIVVGSRHPFARAIHQFCNHSSDTNATATALRPVAGSVRVIPGRGLMSADEAGRTVSLGSLRLIHDEEIAVPPELAPAVENAERAGQPFSIVAIDCRAEGVFIFAEQLRPEASMALRDCQALGCDVAVLTGDHRRRGESLGQQLQVPVLSELLPADKVRAVEQARRNMGPVAMIGDGLNDAPAMVVSDLGIALGCGADLTRESAGVCLLGSDLSRVPWAIHLSRRTVRVIRQNLFWACAYNVVGIGLAAAGWLTPAWASLAMVLSSVLVIVNSLRLRSAQITASQPVVANAVRPASALVLPRSGLVTNP